jgi:hypothetical protein
MRGQVSSIQYKQYSTCDSIGGQVAPSEVLTEKGTCKTPPIFSDKTETEERLSSLRETSRVRLVESTYRRCRLLITTETDEERMNESLNPAETGRRN